MATRNRKKKPEGTRPQSITFADAFARIGGFHRALVLAGAVLAWACEFDADAADTYQRNFGYDPTGDMTAVRAEAVPHHDIVRPDKASMFGRSQSCRERNQIPVAWMAAVRETETVEAH